MTVDQSAVSEDGEAWFVALVGDVEPPLRRALVAAYGAEIGREATVDALGWAWEHRRRLTTMANPTGYLYRVGQTSARRTFRRTGREQAWDDEVARLVADDPEATGVEPALAPALARLSPNQRSAVLLVHGYGYTLAEAAAIQGCRVSTLRNHLARGLAALRTTLGVTDA